MLRSEHILKILENSQLLIRHQNIDLSKELAVFQVDSRLLSTGDAFIAIKGVKFDAHDLLPKIKNIASLNIVECEKAFCDLKDFPSILVRDSRAAWAFLEAALAGNPQESLDFWGVTGTNGKTSSVWLAKELLNAQGEDVLTMGTLGHYLGNTVIPTQHTTPDPNQLFQLLKEAKEKGIKTVIMEVSSHSLAQKKLGPIKFNGALFTSFSRDHLDFHSSMKEYFQEKLSLFNAHLKDQGRKIISSKVVPYFTEFGLDLPEGSLIYGSDGVNDINFQIVQETLTNTELTIDIDHVSKRVTVPLCGRFIIENLVGCLSLFSKKLADSSWQSLTHLRTVPGRLERVEHPNFKGIVLVDYAHTPDALKSCLECIRPLVTGKLICVFGCGGDRDRGKRPLMGKVAAELADIVIVTSDNPRTEEPEDILNDILEAWRDRQNLPFKIIDRELAIAKAVAIAADNDCILIAGKGHEDYQIVGKTKFKFDDRVLVHKYMSTKAEAK